VVADNQIGAIIADALDLGGRRDARHEDLGGLGQFLRGIGDSGTVIAARGSNDTGRRHFPG